MAYTAGDTILDDEYNLFVGGTTGSQYGINHIQGTGNAGYGLGQSTVATVSAGNTVQASQWNSLFTAMDNVANHTNRTLTSTTARSAGDAIAAISALSADLNNLAADVVGGSTAATAVTEGGEDSSRVASAVYDTSHIVEETFTFAGGNEARWFFNAGGKLRMKVTNSATNSTSKDTSLSGVITSVGTFDIGSTTSARSGSGDTATVSASSTGYYDLGTSYTTLLHIEESAGTYANNIEIKYEAKVNSAHGDGNGNNGDVVTVRCSALLNDGTRSDYTSGNTSSVNVEAEAAGPTDFAFHTVDPTTAQGLSTVYTSISVANVSNAIVNND